MVGQTFQCLICGGKDCHKKSPKSLPHIAALGKSKFISMKRAIFYTALGIISLSLVFVAYGRSYWYPVYVKYKGKRTVDEVISEVGAESVSRLKPHFARSGVTYPPQEITMIAFKDTKELQLWASDGTKYELIKTYPILAASGKLGPKLKEGDKQVPEGIYEIEYFNPNSSYHLSMKLNYPNSFDAKYAKLEGREFPGTNIFIHGKSVSIGCLAMGNVAIEELFTLSNEVGRKNIKVIISPSNPKIRMLEPPVGSAEWVKILYKNIEKAITAVSA